jgi:hexosaminidase
MKRIFCLLSFITFIFCADAQHKISILPEPVEIKTGDGFFLLNPSSSISTSTADAELSRLAEQLSAKLAITTGFKMPVRAGGIMTNNVGNILLQINKSNELVLGNEGYRLNIGQTLITISANKPAGLYYGIQSLLQLLPKEIDQKQPVANVNWQVPVADITDYPRFAWRGLMFDVSRHFFTKQEVKDFIDEMVRYKYNLLHMHLTDDEGWRIEIKSYPKLTEKGAWNVKREGTFGNFTPPAADEPRDYGGFYTQEDIREIVKYAKERFVDILPEIDVPGHSLATIASYPELSCTPGADKYVVRSGEKIMNWHSGGFTALVDNTLCPANEKVYTFLDKVFGEIAELFPFEYIHMGGDECAKNFWENNPQIRALMKRENLKDMHEVQSYFVKRVSKIVSSKGKKMIGWDEILEGGLAPNAAVMSWRGMKGGIDAAKMGHEVVMSPTTFVYLDYMQSDAIVEPPVYASLRLKKTYEFEPVPEGVDSKLIKGGQGNIWSEQLYNTRHLQYMTWPRGLAISECLWSPKTARDWNKFAQKVEYNFERMDIRQVKYARAMFDPIFVVKKDERDSVLIELSTEVEGLDIHYSFDNSHPDNFYPKYQKTLTIPKEAQVLKVVTYRNGVVMSRQIDMPVKEIRRRAAALKK